ncbi:MAG: hypothetical protein QOH26_2099, partial [Actinomycetota bacterium]|nr:hypothetical protein [Actinomycetota bacterium]
MTEGRARRRGAIAATIVATLLIPAVGSVAGPGAQLDKNERQLKQVRRQIDALSATEQSLGHEIDQLQASLTRIQMHVVKLEEKIERVQGELRDAQAQIDETQAEIDRVEDIATEQAVELYMDGGTDTLDALLDSASLGELDDKVEMIGVASQNSTNALVKYGRLRAEIEAQNRVMLQKRSELTDRYKDVYDLEQLQKSERAKLSSKMAVLTAKLGNKKDRENHLAAENLAIKELVIEHQAKSAVAALGTSNEGFIWPINGSITSPYGPRWGTMHTGIDIDAVTGQPIVAAKEGRVILASYYSGYGNAV